MARLAQAFETKNSDVKQKAGDSKAEQKITALEAKIARKDEVLGELMEEHIKLKKVLG